MRRKTTRAYFLLLTAACLLALAAGMLTLQTIAQAPEGDGYFPIILRDSGAGASAATTSPAPPSTTKTIDGYPVPDSVYEYYQEVGADVAGRAVTEYRLNAAAGRYEMYFQNFGLYIGVDDPQQEVKPLPLGMIVVFGALGSEPQPALNIPLSPKILALFDEKAALLGQEITGGQLVSLAIDLNGHPTRLFENVVMKVDPAFPDRVSLLELPEMMGTPVNPPVPPSSDARFYFISTSGNLGHNVPLEFWEFIRSNANINETGYPITEIFYPAGSEDTIRQCFQFLCLDYDVASGEIHPTKFGLDYYRRYHTKLADASMPFTLSLNVWESQPAIPPNQAQVISAKITQNDLPVINLQPLLEVTLPNQDPQTYQMPPTSVEGITSIQIPPVSADNGTIIPYQVCVIFADATRYCISDSFLIWNAP